MNPTSKSHLSRMIVFLLIITSIFGIASQAQASNTNGRIVFQNARSRLYVNGEDLNLEVCASNLAGKRVYVHVSRPGKVWTYNQVASGNCLTFVNLEGAGPLLANTTYTTRLGLGTAPDANWPVPCWSATGGYGLCDSLHSGNINPLPERQIFQNARSRLYVNGEDLNLEVCASNLSGKKVYVHVSRPGKVWTYNQVASGNCHTFVNLEGAGPLLANTTYTTRLGLGAAPDANWPVPCWSTTGGYGLCDNLTSANPIDPDPSAYTGIKLPFKSGETYRITGDRTTHSGTNRHAIDIGMSNDPVLAIHAGQIMYRGWDSKGGNMVIINHNDGFCSVYAHLSQINVRFGQTVSQGSVIGVSGSSGYVTGPHLHLAVSHVQGSRCTGEVPMHFDEVPGRELRKGDVVGSQNAVVGGIGDAFAVEAMQELQPGEVNVGYDTSEVYPGTTVSFDIVYYPPQDGAKGLELACQIDPTLLSAGEFTRKELFGSDVVQVITQPDAAGRFNLAVAATGETIVQDAGSAFQLTFETLKAGAATLDCDVTQIGADESALQLQFEPVSLKISEDSQEAPTDPVDGGEEPPVITPDPTDPPEDEVQISGQVIVPAEKYASVTISVYDLDGQPVTEISPDAAGKFNLTLAAAAYEFEASLAGYLTARGAFEAQANTPLGLPAITLIAGDVTGDGLIDDLDVVTMGATYKLLPLKNTAADLNGDNQVDILDLVALANHYGIAGLQTWK